MSYKAHNKRYEKMSYRRCGESGLKLPSITLGLWHNFGGKTMPTESKKIIFRAFDRGVTHFDLANNYGNLCQRIFSFVKNNCNNKVIKNKNISTADKKLIEQTSAITKDLRDLMNNQNLNNYIKSVINISFLTNKYINDEEPWILKDNKEKMNNILHLSLEQIAKISILLNPIIPKATTKVLEALKINLKSTNLSFLDGKDLLSKEIVVNDLNILFKKIN